MSSRVKSYLDSVSRILSVLRFCSAAQRAGDKTFSELFYSHTTKVLNWLFPANSLGSAGFFGIAEHAQDLGVEAQVELHPSSWFSISCAFVLFFLLDCKLLEGRIYFSLFPFLKN